MTNSLPPATAELQDVFKKSGVPTHTFVEASEFNRVLVALRTAGRGMIIEGPSGIGKTSSIRRAVEKIPGLECRFLTARRTSDVQEIEGIPDRDNFGLIIIDDFHRLEESLKQRLADKIKLLSDEEDDTSKLVLIGINRAGQSLIDYAPDLLHRVEIIRFGRTNIERIAELIARGQEALNCTIAAADGIAEESEGSFAMAQVLCHEACLQAGVLASETSTRLVEVSLPAIRESIIKELTPNFYQVAKDFATGNKLRREGRAPYLHLLKWLSATPEGDLDTREAIRANPTLKGSVSQVIEKEHLSMLISGNTRISAIIHFDSVSQLLTVEDPKFLYFIRHLVWSKFARQVGYDNLEFIGRYDYALSFAGEDREIARALYESLASRELTVFYDENESHRILGNDVEEYLAPIYRTEANYVLPMISSTYPRKIWTKFESDQFKNRFGENSVLPILIDDFNPSQFDMTADVGHMRVRRQELQADLDIAVEMLCQKIVDDRARREGADQASGDEEEAPEE
ncbi:TIR domain-containing protein [Pseudomonas gingeri]|uniref:TIR domain-containing protein n=1 Tax=Pseudomonas gingeri TaxID=117681 RepID=A0A7Y8C6D5_9PSED|nr:TIR domain-containing protein [Pseudomonas gingeri]NWC00835.1 TIR domain-containing protein [Pseudomonas gingeri]